jgi:16S rRNA (guanine966-N2)-methyltransferase
MRIIAGVAGGRPLRSPAGEGTRPTADRVKEAWFSSLQPWLAGAHVLDLFAGSGALGLEALSRGARRVTFVEKDRRALAALHDNVATVGLPGATVCERDVAAALSGELPGAPFSVVVADPPYAVDGDELSSLVRTILGHLADEAIVTIERDRRSDPPRWPSGLLDAGSRRYGDTVLHRAVRDPGPTDVGSASAFDDA